MTDKTYTERQLALIEKYRDINTDYEWWDCTKEDFKADMAKKHITVRDVNFTGFWSQGDGASFTGYVSDNKLFLQTHGLSETYPVVSRLMQHGGGFSIAIERNSNYHYVHENTVYAEVSYTDGFCHVLDSDEFRDLIIEQWDKDLQAEYDRLAEEVTTIIRGYCKDLYRQLEEEYEYLTSDEAVWEAIQANELDDELEDEEETA
jgi:hypothetical protein